jgi:hypothetical protein
MRFPCIGVAALCLVLAAAPLAAQPTPQGRTPPGTEMGPQRPDPTAIPEKFGPSIDEKKPIRPEERTGEGNSGAQPPHNRGLDLQSPSPEPKTMSEPSARPAQSP